MAHTHPNSEEENELGLLYDFSQASHSGEPGFDPYQNDKNEQFYFLFNDKEGQPILFSQGFASLEKRDQYIRRVIKSSQTSLSYRRRNVDEGSFFIVVDESGEEIARSKTFDTEEELETNIAYVMAEAPTYNLIYPETPKNKKGINDYDFEQGSNSGIAGFDLFRSEKNKLFYFHFNDASGKPILYSESYASSRSRRNGIISVIKNGDQRSNYQSNEEEGLYFASLIAANGQEIARSKSYKSSNELEEQIKYLIEEIPNYSEQFVNNTPTEAEASFQLSTAMSKQPQDNSNSSRGAMDDYDLTQPSRSGKEGFDSFLSEKNGEYYFHFNDASGEPFFYSEGYTSHRSRDNGIRSVIKNSIKEKHYTDKEDEEGKFFTLRAGNYQEIGRSKYFTSENGLKSAKDYFQKNVHRFASENGVEDLEVPSHLMAAAMSRSLGSDSGTDDDYDLTQPTVSGSSGFDSFLSDKHGQYYFHYNGEDGEPIFFSEGYQNDKSRDNGIRSVIKNSIVDAHFADKEDEEGKFFTLRAGNYQEIGRSKYFESDEDRAAAMAYFQKNVHLSAAEHGVEGLEVPAHLMASVLGRGLVADSGGADDYDLTQPTVSGKEGFDPFYSEKHGQYYFHYNEEDGQPLFFSEGYQNDKSRDNGIKSVIKNSVVEEHYAEKEDEEGKFFTLRAGNYQEIGRSKYFDSEDELAMALAWFKQNVHKSASAFGLSLIVPTALEGSKTALGGGLAEETETVEKSGNDYDGDGKPDTIHHKPYEHDREEDVHEEEERGRPWWLWILLLLLLLLLLFFLLRGCEGSPFNGGVAGKGGEKVELASKIRLGEMGNLQSAFENGYLDKATYGAILEGKMNRGEVDWASNLNGDKLISAGLLSQSDWKAIQSGEMKDWDWMQMKPGTEVFGGLGGLKGAQNGLYLDVATADSLRLGDLDVDDIDLEKKLDIAKLIGAGILTEDQSNLLKPGQEGWNAIMIAKGGSSNLQLGAWGSIEDLLKNGVITQALYDSLVQAGQIDLENFDWENNINLQAAAANTNLITATLVDEILNGETGFDWENMKKIPLTATSPVDVPGSDSGSVGSVSGEDSNRNSADDRESELTPLPTYGPYSGFATASANITEAEIPNFERLVDYLKKNASYKAIIIGHADERGAEDTNMRLGSQRANTVKGLLIKNGISASRIETKSAGESQPKTTNATVEGRAVNRRVEIELRRN